jgi:hypothetical protein
MFTTTVRNSIHFHSLYSVSQHISAYVEAIFKCGFLSDNTILKKLPLLNGSVDSTALHSVRSLLFSILKFVIQLYNCKHYIIYNQLN